jgi:predicted SprT family Zn-dependent metalloprotease
MAVITVINPYNVAALTHFDFVARTVRHELRAGHHIIGRLAGEVWPANVSWKKWMGTAKALNLFPELTVDKGL